MLNINKRYCVVGTGLTGLATVRYLLSNHCTVEILDTREKINNEDAIALEFKDLALCLGNLESFVFTPNDILVVSPGIALSENFIANAIKSGAVISSDVEIFLKQNTKPVVAITGSNGKSTVVSLLASVLNSVSVKAIAAGNIGLPALEVINNDIDVFVLELSSFQLERMTTCPSSVACMLNLSEDHMDRYDSMDDYAQAKHIIYKGALSTVFNISEVLTQASSDAPSFSFGKLSEQADFSYDSANGGIYYQNECLLNAGDLTIKGSHNIENVLAVLAILKQLIQQSVISCSLKDCLAAIKTFSGLSHRSQFVATVDHVDYIDDSKATNVGASLAALLGLQSSYSEIIILIGGVDKASDFSKLINYIANHQVRAVIYGQDAPVIQSAFDLESVPYSNAKTMLQALDVAIKCAAHKSAILLAPACASFDEFKNFSERGDAFINAVKRLATNEGACS